MAGQSLASSLQMPFFRVAMPFSILVFQFFLMRQCTLSRRWIQQHVPKTSKTICSSPFVSSFVSLNLIFSRGLMVPTCLLHEGQSIVKRLLFCPVIATVIVRFWNPPGSLEHIGDVRTTIWVHKRQTENKRKTHFFPFSPPQKHHSPSLQFTQNQVKTMLFVEECQGKKSDKSTARNCSL